MERERERTTREMRQERGERKRASNNTHIERPDTKRHRKTRLYAEGSTKESEGGGFGLFKCPGCGRRVINDGDYCDSCRTD
jgi:hypothetical protein